MTVRLEPGDCIEIMARLKTEGVVLDAVVTDPPYHLTSIVKRFGSDNAAPAQEGRDGLYARASRGFMGQRWDGVERPAIDAGLAHWLAGFADGEGCFTARKSGKGYVCEFVIHLRADDIRILRELRAATEIGDVDGPTDRGDGAAPMAKWVVRRQADCARLIQIFRAFPLRAKKARDFEIWASAVEEWIKHEPGTSWADIASHAELLSAVKRYGSTFDASQFFHYRWARLAFELLKPGGHIVAFGGTRTFHRLAAAIEDAGFEIRDQLAWVYGSGFPKSHNQKGEWQGWGTALKPAWEPIVLARKPLEGTIAANVQKHGTGAINIDGCRVQGTWERNSTTRSDIRGGAFVQGVSGGLECEPQSAHALGRWPANILHDGSEEVLAAFPNAPGQQRAVGPEHGDKSSVNCYGDYGPRDTFAPRNDSGSAARFFYSAKADKQDRWGSKHPTVKPVELMRWLCRLITPPGGLILDPFAGSGSTGVAALAEGFDAILIEREPAYVADIEARLAWYRGEGAHRSVRLNKARDERAAKPMPLFGGAA